MRKNLIAAIEKAELSQIELADRLGVERKAVNRWVAGTQTPHSSMCKKIRKVLDNQDEDLFKIFDDPQEPQSCASDSRNDTVDSSDSHLVGIPESEGELSNMDKGRRNLNGTITAGIIAASTGIALVRNTQIITGPVIEPEEHLAQCSITIDSCWGWLNQGNFNRLERALQRTIPTLTKLATSVWTHQGTAANLVVQANIMQILLATRNLDFLGREFYCAEAVRFGELSGNSDILAIVRGWQGNTYTLCYRQPQRAIAIFNDVLSFLNSDTSQLTRSTVYSNLSVAHAQDKDETKAEENEKKARDYAEQARMMMPQHPELEPYHQYNYFGQSELDQMEGIAYLYLSGKSQNNDYALIAYNAFDKATKQALDQGYLSGSLIKKADAARAMGVMDHCVDCLRDGLVSATEINSIRRISDAYDVIHRVPESWQRETAIKNLQKDASQALVVARR